MNWRMHQLSEGSSELESPFIGEDAWLPAGPAHESMLAEADATAMEWEATAAVGTEWEIEEDRFEGRAEEALDGDREVSTGDELEGHADEHEEHFFESGDMLHEATCSMCGAAQEAERGVEGEFGVDLEADSTRGFEALASGGGEEAESLRQDDLAMEAELGLLETPVPESWELESASGVPPDITSFAGTLGAEWSQRRNGTPTAESISKWLLQDYGDTIAGAKKRWGKKFGTGKLTLEAIGRAWMISRRENLGFQMGSRGVKPLGQIAPPPSAVTLVSSSLVDDSKTSPVAPLVVRFMEGLRARYQGVRAANYPGHGGGKFNGRGFSLDLYIGALDERGFYPRDEAIRFLRQLHDAATAVGAQWRIIYNDFSVADVVNRALGRQHVIFMGKARKSGTTVTGLNWHGPAPLILHFHLDLAILVGAASRWNDAAASGGPSAASATGSSSVRPLTAVGATASATAASSPLANLEQQLMQDVRASWSRAGLTPPEPQQIGAMKPAKSGFKRYIASGLFVDDVAKTLRARNLLSISDEDIDMLQRASNVETGGRLTALNSWDSAFMSVGFMQWTLKYRKLQQWIALAPAAFRRYGIELEPARSYAFSSTHKEKAIVGAARASDLRSAEWGVRFYMASLDLDAIVAELRRAVDVSNEVRRAVVDPHGAAVVAHYDRSPVLRALVQETYNNRPAYMKQAMRNVAPKASTDAATFLDLVRKEIVATYTARENAPSKAANLIRKTASRRI
jgi:hypothetical protein